MTGGERVEVNGKGCFVEPTIFADVAQDDPLARDEIFGPVLSVIAFDEEADAVRMANDSIYGAEANASVEGGVVEPGHRPVAMPGIRPLVQDVDQDIRVNESRDRHGVLGSVP